MLRFKVRILSYLVASALVDELSTQKSADWNTMMDEIEPLLTESEGQVSQTVTICMIHQFVGIAAR